jgi:hypothetical protein
LEHARRHAGLVQMRVHTIAFRGAISLGLRTIVQPAASAASTLQAI